MKDFQTPITIPARTLLALLCAVTLASCQHPKSSSDSAPKQVSPEWLVGTWQIEGSGQQVSIFPNGDWWTWDVNGKKSSRSIGMTKIALQPTQMELQSEEGKFVFSRQDENRVILLFRTPAGEQIDKALWLGFRLQRLSSEAQENWILNPSNPRK